LNSRSYLRGSVFTFTRSERLKSAKAIEFLFTKGAQKSFFPLKIFVAKAPRGDEEKFPVKFMVSVPKKKIKSAVQRNRVKRIIREVWRLNKQSLYDEMLKNNFSANIMFMYLSSDIPDFKTIEKKIPPAFIFILTELSKK
jgi:ribonuclease P protein component